MRSRLALGAFTLCSLHGATAVADQLSDPRPDYTAYTRPQGVLAASLFKAELGILDELMVGTYVPPWFAFPVLKVPIPSVYVKGRSWFEGPVTIALRGGAVYIDAKALAKLAEDSATAGALALSGELDLSYRFDERFSLTLGATSNTIHAAGGGDDRATEVEGAAVADTTAMFLFGEWRLSRVFALTLLSQVLVYQSPYETSATGSGPGYEIESELSVQNGANQSRLNVVPGVSFSWERWELHGGVGYGVFFLPVLGIATQKSWPVVDFSFAYRFDLY
jgi:hypothetical protein